MIRRRHPATAKLAIFFVATALIGTVLTSLVGNISLKPTHTYSAIFTDALRLTRGIDVRLAGVLVGHVRSVELVDGKHAKVTFDVFDDVPVFRDAEVHGRYADLMGNRYLALVQRPSSGGRMPAGGTFGLDRTRPALNLTALFNGFQPLFQALSPRDVNQLSHEIIQTLQGEGPSLAALMRDTAQLTRALADKDAVIGRVVDNLTTVLGTLDERDEKLTDLIVRFRDLMRGLAGDREVVDDALPGLAGLLATGGDLVADIRRPLSADIKHLGEVSSALAADSGELDAVLKELPGKLAGINRTASYGSWLNFYLCRLELRVTVLGEAIPLTSPAALAADERDTVCGGMR